MYRTYENIVLLIFSCFFFVFFFHKLLVLRTNITSFPYYTHIKKSHHTQYTKALHNVS